MGDRFHGPGFFAGAGLPAWATVALYALSIVPWVVVPGLLLWAASRWGAVQPAPKTGPALEPALPRAAELLRQRYVLGEIDAMTFEEMLERVLHSEAREASAQLSATPERHVSAPRYRVYPVDEEGEAGALG